MMYRENSTARHSTSASGSIGHCLHGRFSHQNAMTDTSGMPTSEAGSRRSTTGGEIVNDKRQWTEDDDIVALSAAFRASI